MKLFRPEVFQGRIHSGHYFEGWYLKHLTGGFDHILSFIPGVSLTRKDPHAFIQVINGITGRSWYLRHPLSSFEWDHKYFRVKIGRSVFSRDHSSVDISQNGLEVHGKITYHDMVRYPASFLSPGIMGWYSFVPFMECKHGVVSVDHTLKGRLEINGERIDFSGGRGYIEKDWGTSFPAGWLWLHSNAFTARRVSVMLSIARIPWLGSYFMGFLCFLFLDGEFFLFSTYNGSKITEVTNNEEMIRVHLTGKSHGLRFQIFPGHHGYLQAPVRGEMKRKIRESMSSGMVIDLYDRSAGSIFRGEAVRTGLEVTENIFDLLKQ